MIFGFNTDVDGEDAVYHVQTEDRGEKNPVVDSIIYIKGKIVDRRRTPYVPGEVSTSQVEEMVRQQHRALVEAIRSGTFIPSCAQAEADGALCPAYNVELRNAADLARGECLQFEFVFSARESSSSIAGLAVEARWLLDGQSAANDAVQIALDGRAAVSFPVPAESSEAALLVCIQGPLGKQFSKYRVSAARA